MRFHWYWPFAREEELAWARATLRPDDELVIQVIDRSVAPAAQAGGSIRVLRDLPDVDRDAGRMAWALSRARTYRARGRARRSLWRRQPVDLVHLHYVNRFTDAWSRFPRPLVMSVHDVVPHQPRLGRAERLVLGRLYRRPDALVVHHRSIGERLTADFDVDEQLVHVVPHQVFPVPGGPTGRPGGRPKVLFFGALRANKGLDVLDAALPLLPDDVDVIVAGRGDADVEALARAMAARDPRVTADIRLVPLHEKRALLRASSVVVLPYVSFASQSGVLHDAYGHGRPVVVTDVGALGDAVREDGSGAVVPPREPAALADAVRDVLADEAWHRHASAAAAVAEARSPEVVGRRLREVYDAVLG